MHLLFLREQRVKFAKRILSRYINITGQYFHSHI